MRFVCPALLLEKVSCCSNPIACGDDTDAPKKKKILFSQTWPYNSSTKGKHDFDSILPLARCFPSKCLSFYGSKTFKLEQITDITKV